MPTRLNAPTAVMCSARMAATCTSAAAPNAKTAGQESHTSAQNCGFNLKTSVIWKRGEDDFLGKLEGCR
jgi:hypothetical protein